MRACGVAASSPAPLHLRFPQGHGAGGEARHLGLPHLHGARRPFCVSPPAGRAGSALLQCAGSGLGPSRRPRDKSCHMVPWPVSPERPEGAARAPSSTAAPPGIFLPAFARAAPPRRQARPAAPPLLVVARSVIRGCSRRCCNTRNKGPRFPCYDIHCYPPFEPLYYNRLSRPPAYKLSNPRNYYRIGPPSPPGFP